MAYVYPSSFALWTFLYRSSSRGKVVSTARENRVTAHIHPSHFVHLSEITSWWQQAKQSVPGLPGREGHAVPPEGPGPTQGPLRTRCGSALVRLRCVSSAPSSKCDCWSCETRSTEQSRVGREVGRRNKIKHPISLQNEIKKQKKTSPTVTYCISLLRRQQERYTLLSNEITSYKKTC